MEIWSVGSTLSETDSLNHVFPPTLKLIRQMPPTTQYYARGPCAQLPKWLVFILAVLFLAAPAAALPNDHYAQGSGASNAVATSMLLAGHRVVSASVTLVGPLMGISSVLWFVMRNDAAIKPKSSWM